MEQFTELIDVPRLLFNILWILGLSIIVAALSLRQFEAKVESISFRKALEAYSFQLSLWIGLTLVTIGFAGNADALWEQVAWLVLTILNGMQLFNTFREHRSPADSE